MDTMQPMTLMDGAQVALTAVVAYAVLFLLTKLVGNKQISQMTMFDYISGISIGSIAAEMATELEGPIRPLIGLVVFGLLTYVIAVWTNHSLAARRTFTGKPLIVFDKGTIYRKNLKKAKMDLSEFLALCRIGGYFDLTQLESAVFEHNGNLSFLPKEAYRSAQPTDLQLSPKQSNLLLPIIMDGQVLHSNLKAVGKDETWLAKKLREQDYADAREVFLALCDESGEAPQIYPIKPKNEPKIAE